MKKTAVFASLCFIGLYLQGVLIKGVVPTAVVPDCILILVVFLALHYPTPAGMFGAFMLGLAADFASGEFVGPNAAGAVVSYSFGVFVSKKVYAEHLVATVLLVFISSLVKTITVLGFFAIYVNVNALKDNLGIIFGEAIFTAILAPPFLLLLRLGRKHSPVKS